MLHLSGWQRAVSRWTELKNKRVYNLVENLCISQGMTMLKVYIIEDDSLNAFASGISKRSYSVSLSRGIINKLDDEELEAVIAHELTHIKNKDASAHHLDHLCWHFCIPGRTGFSAAFVLPGPGKRKVMVKAVVGLS